MPAIEKHHALQDHVLSEAARDTFESSELDIEWSFELCFQAAPPVGLETVEAVVRTPALYVALQVEPALEPEEQEIDIEYSFRA
jgi:hypothetical protein